jgi:drug/metabolite transporter (DMT)-like permease
MTGMSNRSYGIILVTMAAFFWSIAGLFMRMLDLDVWTILVWRSVFGSAALWLVVLWQNRRPDPAGLAGDTSAEAAIPFSWPGIAAVLLSTISMVSYITALKLTTVANVLAIYATIPFVCVGIAWLWLGERIDRRVLVASSIAFLGVLVVAGFATRPEDVLGNLMAFSMTVSFSVMVIMAQRYRGMDMAKANAIGCMLCALICWPMMAGETPSLFEMLLLCGFGVTSTALAYLLFLTGSRYIPSGEAGLIALLDVVLGPLWVWLAFSEEPAVATVIGSGLILSAVVWYFWASLRSARIALPG